MDAGLLRKILLKYAKLFAAKYAEFGEICGAYMRHIFRRFPSHATSSDGES